MPSPKRRLALRRATKPLSLLPVALASATLLAACGSSSSGGAQASSSGSPTPASTSSSSNSAGSSKTAGSATITTTKVSGYGTVLANAAGTPLYLLTADPSGGSSCSGACAKQWPPLTATGKPSAGTGVSASMLSSFKRSDGTEQVLYDGHALYTHSGISATAAAGTAADGGIWYLVSPTGKPIKSTTGSGY